ncbi:MAG: ribonuclease HII [Christensenellaceae bacterium]|nr:ribonuclease HII [Christensenellaceae bacterium]
MPKIDERVRLEIMTKYERPFWDRGILVAGMDEVGRGPLAGPVVAACVILPADCLIEGVNDSKKLSEKKRERLYDEITKKAIAWSSGWVWQDTIDEINILQATKKAFVQAYSSMKYPCDHVFIDAVKELDIPSKQYPIVHGDALCYSIAAASIIAKVERDRYMVSMAKKHPQYGFEKNKGYGTKQHISALGEFGPCEIHRSTFIKNFI